MGGGRENLATRGGAVDSGSIDCGREISTQITGECGAYSKEVWNCSTKTQSCKTVSPHLKMFKGKKQRRK